MSVPTKVMLAGSLNTDFTDLVETGSSTVMCILTCCLQANLCWHLLMGDASDAARSSKSCQQNTRYPRTYGVKAAAVL